jgi:hypothetical protein
MIQGFGDYVFEVFGADTMQKDPMDLIISPDTKRANAMSFYAGASGTIPTHWNNSPFLTGGRLTSAFGLNPKATKKKNVLNYHEFIKTTKNFSKSK